MILFYLYFIFHGILYVFTIYNFISIQECKMIQLKALSSLLLTFQILSNSQTLCVEDREWQLVHNTLPHVSVFFCRNEPFC